MANRQKSNGIFGAEAVLKKSELRALFTVPLTGLLILLAALFEYTFFGKKP